MLLKNKLLGLLTLAIGMSLIGCSTATERIEEVTQDKIYQSYSVSYEQEKNTTEVTARFTFGGSSGTNLKLTGKSAITHNLFSLKERDFLGVHYQAEGNGFHPNHSFVFTDSNGKSFANSTSITPIELAAVPGVHSRGVKLTLNWVGLPLSDKERVYVFIEGNNNNAVGSTSTKGATSVDVETRELNRLVPGNYSVVLKREKSIDLQQGTQRGGHLSSSYTTLKRNITITE